MRWVVQAVALLFFVSASVSASERDTRTETLLELAGVHVFVAGFSHQIGGPDNPMAHSFSGMADAWVAAAGESFGADAMFADMVTHFETTLTEEDRKTLLAFYRGDLGMRISAMEISAQRPANAVRLKTLGARLLRDLVATDSDRLAAYGDMIEALGAVDTGLAMAMNLNRAVIGGMVASGDFPLPMSDAQIAAMVETQRGLMRGAIEEQLRISIAYTYQDLSDDELTAYIAFLRSPAGRRFYSELAIAIEATMTPRAKTFGQRLMELRHTTSL